MHEYGLGTGGVDYAKAIEWYSRAAEQVRAAAAPAPGIPASC